MKPVVDMDGKKADIVTVTDMNAPEKVTVIASKRFSSKRIIIGVLAAVVTLAVVAAIVLGAVYFGSNITTESFKVVHQTLKTDKGEEIEEETNVTKTEVDVRIPNVAEVIYDYKNGIVVTRFVNRETNVRSECLAQYMNETTVPNRDPEAFSDSEVEMYEDDNKEERKSEEQWIRTDDEVQENMISENVARACRGTKIYWLKKVENHNGGKVKRQTCVFGYFYICFRLRYPCSYKCHFIDFCRNNGSIRRIFWGYGCKVGCYPGRYNPVCPRRGRRVS